MTEAEWRESDDPRAILACVRHAAGDRKPRLLFCALSRAVWPLLDNASSREAVEVAERYADGQATDDELFSAEYWSEVVCLRNIPDRLHQAAAYLAEYATRSVIVGFDPEADRPFGFSRECEYKFAAMADAQTPASELVRDIFGNPFREITFSPAWRTDTAVSLARQMYDAREFSPMPILADALQDAGCDNADVLNHCRSGEPHVRGCWVVDLVLGKG